MSQGFIERDKLAKYLEQALDINRFRDYCPNGLQVEGRTEIKTIVTGVTASKALIEAAIDIRADAILVHHGYFWQGEDSRMVGIKKKRLQLLLSHDINLYAYHLPLDIHPEFGNNIQLAHQLGLKPLGHFGENGIGWLGRVTNESIRTVADLALIIEERLGRSPLVIGDPAQAVGVIGWCTGAAQNMLGDAIENGASVYLSGEISEPTVHLARESQVAYLACGHHATERYGVQALGAHLSSQFGIEHCFVDIANPV